MPTASVVDKTAPNSVKVAETRYGKDIKISRCKNGRLFQIDVAGGGTKPPELDGHFTRYADAEDAVKRYVDGGNGRVSSKVAPIVDFTAKADSVLPPLTPRKKLTLTPKEEPALEPEFPVIPQE